MYMPEDYKLYITIRGQVTVYYNGKNLLADRVGDGKTKSIGTGRKLLCYLLEQSHAMPATLDQLEREVWGNTVVRESYGDRLNDSKRPGNASKALSNLISFLFPGDRKGGNRWTKTLTFQGKTLLTLTRGVLDEVACVTLTVLRDDPDVYVDIWKLESGKEAFAETEDVVVGRSEKYKANLDIPNNLLSQGELFVGRSSEIVKIKETFASNPMVTLVGAGGCGKTTLAKQVAREMLSAYPDGAWFVDLVNVSDASVIAKWILDEIRIDTDPNKDSMRILIEYLQPRKILLILDNCEHLYQRVTEYTDRLLSRCRSLHILTTTRRTQAEGKWGWEYLVNPFAVLDPDDSPDIELVEQNEAIQIFVNHRIAKGHPEFKITEENAQIVVQICHRVNGIPLAIKLAAGNRQSLHDIADTMANHWRSLPIAGEESGARHETMDYCIAWSHKFLRESERRLFRRLSIFEGGWTLKNCQAVCTMDDLKPGKVSDHLEELLQSSLVILDEGTDRYSFLMPICEFAAHQLEMSGEKAAIEERFATLNMPKLEFTDPIMIGTHSSEQTTDAVDEQRNLDKLIVLVERESPLRAKEMELTMLLLRFAEGTLCRATKRMDRLKSFVGVFSRKQQIHLCLCEAVLAFLQSEFADALKAIENGLELSLEIGNREYASAAYSAAGICNVFLGREEGARQIEQARQIAEELKSEWHIAFAHMCQGAWFWHHEELMPATRQYTEALLTFQKRNDELLCIFVLNSLAHLLRRQGDYRGGAQRYLESMTLSYKRKNARGLVGCILGSCGVALGLKRYEEAALYLGAATRHYNELGARLIPIIQSDYDREIPIIQQELGTEFELHYDLGYQISLLDAAKKARLFLESCTTVPQTKKRPMFAVNLPK